MREFEPGTYLGTPKKAVMTEAKTGTPQMVVEFEIDGKSRSVYLPFTEGSLPYTKAKLERIGWNGDLEEPEFTATDVKLTCSHDERGGKKHEKWDIAAASVLPEKNATAIKRAKALLASIEKGDDETPF